MEEKGERRKEEESSSGVVVNWERFLQRMMVRVLLVEADDSTRQIIVALLRKCNYKVAAVADGLKAWELLKGRPHNIDLILTEVDLPSISGFPLLTLIMEHDICKHIPVIMMSSKDSVSTVYKCMARGAADYLVKPIRRNELRNLWQHVWRRLSSIALRNGPQDESVAQDKVEVTAENDAASNHSSGCMAGIQRNNKYVEKGSDAQSSCTKPDFAAESAHIENALESSNPNPGKSSLSHLKSQKDEAETELCQKFLVHEREAGGSVVGEYEDADVAMTLGPDIKQNTSRIDTYIAREAYENIVAPVNSSRDACNLIQTFTKYPKCTYENSPTNHKRIFDCASELDLSLRTCQFSGFTKGNVTEERHTLRQSNASAFTRYICRPSQNLPTKLNMACDEQNEYGTNHEKHIFGTSNIPDSMLSTPKSTVSLITDQSNHSVIATSYPLEKVFPSPILVKGVRFNDLSSPYGSILPPIFHTQSASSPMPSPKTFYNSNTVSHNTEHLYDPIPQNANISTTQRMHKQENKLDSLEDQMLHISPGTDQSSSNSFCNGAVTHLIGVGYGSASGSNSNNDQGAFLKAALDSKNEEALLSHGGNSHRLSQREAALTKFRMKRKDRCYEKKVRYESRKKLAEQRPRVKGQFVRQLHIDISVAETNGSSFNY